MERGASAQNVFWLGLMVIAGIFAVLYLRSSVFPGPIDPAVLKYFSPQLVKNGRAYSQVPRILYIVGFLLQAGFLVWFVFGGCARRWQDWLMARTGQNYWGSVFLFFLTVWLVLTLLNLPLTFYNSYVWQHRWGFSTESLPAWWSDYFKSTALDFLLSAAAVLIVFWVLNRWPRTWWLFGAILFGLWLIVQDVLWPVVVAPLFNHFRPVDNPAITGMVHDLSLKSGVPVKDVLVMDASRRTTKVNAYFTGLGKTKRIVLYDTLLKFPLDEIRAVVAHEMGHWQKRHVLIGTVLGILGGFIAWRLLAFALHPWYTGAGRAAPQVWAVIQLFFLLALFVTNPVQNAISREMERQADQVSLQLTQDPQAEVRLQIDLAKQNLTDFSPPPFIVWFGYSHPTPLQRIKAMQGAGK
ncbi:Ste24 endopeptidase [Acididesulfobacillus acetoxydans]|uniref:Ste24 endopeptidase n=1 Tax=Acididesulfobacillus acetoxydans TaxID=1561005 RepID=A0A8S0W831_9FIRM|nr:M48 family metallopeptidase [Acididesulfobacillus acetoxydans]CAA7601429.1 Ste24 endopeptidase [Acididesulfobacillus acetoxydans]CEJ08860.1 Zn-dependent protease with chaperone function [Acididesulfobacillus acetoxydans]